MIRRSGSVRRSGRTTSTPRRGPPSGSRPATLWINSPQRVFDELPFGGWGASGFGKEHGIEALEHYMEAKSVVVRRSRPS